MSWFKVQIATPEQWADISADAHMIGFGEKQEPDHRYDFIVVAVDDKQILGYIGVLEHSGNHAHMQHGAAMPSIRKSGKTREVYNSMMFFLKQKYNVLTAQVFNANIPMISLHHGQDLRIIGCNCYSDGVYLHMRWEFQCGK